MNRCTAGTRGLLLLGLAVLSIIASPVAYVLAASSPVRPAAKAGSFYPDSPSVLRAAVEAFLADARPAVAEAPTVLASPHAGYMYSGQIAADAWAQAAGFEYDLIVILGTNHTTAGFRGVSVYDGEAYATPLGPAVIDRAAVRRLLDGSADCTFRPEVHRDEHSVEVQLPFARVLFPDTPILAAVIGAADAGLCSRFGRDLAAVLQGRRALIVASTDLSHYPSSADARRADFAVLRGLTAETGPRAADRFRQAIAEQMRSGLPGLSTCACGEGPVAAAVVAAAELDARRIRVVSYANSGDCAIGDPQRAVGYAAVAIDAGAGPNRRAGLTDVPVPGPGDNLDAVDRRALLALARETLRRYLDTETVPLARDFAPAAWRYQGAFVTLKKDGQLRGCIGHMAEDRPLCRVVGGMALQAAFGDRRFPGLRRDELDEIEIEISVLTPFAPVAGPEAIRVGRDGVVLRKSGKSAVFLPQVATEQGWNREQMLDQLSRKAGLPAGAWRRGAELLTFQAEVFSEAHP